MGGEEQALVATEEACRVYVGNLLPKAKEVHLTSKFSHFGTIHSVWIARRPPGFAFVRFATPDAAQRAVDACQEDGSMEILGKAVRVQMAGDKDMKNATASQKQASSSSRTKDTDSSTLERGEYDRREGAGAVRGIEWEVAGGVIGDRGVLAIAAKGVQGSRGQGQGQNAKGEVDPDPVGEDRVVPEVEVGIVKFMNEHGAGGAEALGDSLFEPIHGHEECTADVPLLP